MTRHPHAGGTFMRKTFGVEMDIKNGAWNWTKTSLNKVYYSHKKLVDKYSIPVIDLEMPDAEKWKVLLNNLPENAVVLEKKGI